MRTKAGRWEGYADTLSGREIQEGRGQYGIGVHMARRHIREFQSKERNGRSYAEAQRDALAIEAQNRVAIDKKIVALSANEERLRDRAKKLKETAGLVAADISNISTLPPEWRSKLDVQSIRKSLEEERKDCLRQARSLEREAGEIALERRELVRAKNCPCSKCEAFAICGALSLACPGFVKWVNSPRVCTMKIRQIPSAEVFAQLQIES